MTTTCGHSKPRHARRGFRWHHIGWRYCKLPAKWRGDDWRGDSGVRCDYHEDDLFEARLIDPVPAGRQRPQKAAEQKDPGSPDSRPNSRKI